MRARIKKIAILALFCLTISFAKAQSDNYFFNWNDYRTDEDDPTAPLMPTSHGEESDAAAPIGSGVALLVIFGASYCALKRTRRGVLSARE